MAISFFDRTQRREARIRVDWEATVEKLSEREQVLPRELAVVYERVTAEPGRRAATGRGGGGPRAGRSRPTPVGALRRAVVARRARGRRLGRAPGGRARRHRVPVPRGSGDRARPARPERRRARLAAAGG